MYKEYLQHPNENRANKFKTHRNKINNLIRKLLVIIFKNTRNNIKETWKTINSIIGRGTKEPPQNNFKTDSKEYITELKTISNDFDNVFVHIGLKQASEIHHRGKQYLDYLIKQHKKYISCVSFTVSFLDETP